MKLNAKIRKAINSALSDLCRVRHEAIPIADLDKLLLTHGLQSTEPAIYCGRDGRANLEVGADNSLLVLTWYKGDVDGRYEIVAYMS